MIRNALIQAGLIAFGTMVVPAHAQTQADPGEVIEVITAEVPTSQLVAADDVPSDFAAAQSRGTQPPAAQREAAGGLDSAAGPIATPALDGPARTVKTASSAPDADGPTMSLIVVAALIGGAMLALLLGLFVRRFHSKR